MTAGGGGGVKVRWDWEYLAQSYHLYGQSNAFLFYWLLWAYHWMEEGLMGACHYTIVLTSMPCSFTENCFNFFDSSSSSSSFSTQFIENYRARTSLWSSAGAPYLSVQFCWNRSCSIMRFVVWIKKWPIPCSVKFSARYEVLLWFSQGNDMSFYHSQQHIPESALFDEDWKMS